MWPAGYTARLDGEGRLELLDSANGVVAREGDTVQVGGGMASESAEPLLPCAPTSAFVVNSAVTVRKRR